MTCRRFEFAPDHQGKRVSSRLSIHTGVGVHNRTGVSMSENSEGKQPSRKRGLTSLTLAWLSEKLRRAEDLKEQVKSGVYQVDSEKLAASLVNKDN